MLAKVTKYLLITLLLSCVYAKMFKVLAISPDFTSDEFSDAMDRDFLNEKLVPINAGVGTVDDDVEQDLLAAPAEKRNSDERLDEDGSNNEQELVSSNLVYNGFNNDKQDELLTAVKDAQDAIDQIAVLIRSMRDHAIGIIKDMAELEVDLLGACDDDNEGTKSNGACGAAGTATTKQKPSCPHSGGADGGTDNENAPSNCANKQQQIPNVNANSDDGAQHTNCLNKQQQHVNAPGGCNTNENGMNSGNTAQSNNMGPEVNPQTNQTNSQNSNMKCGNAPLMDINLFASTNNNDRNLNPKMNLWRNNYARANNNNNNNQYNQMNSKVYKPQQALREPYMQSEWYATILPSRQSDFILQAQDAIKAWRDQIQEAKRILESAVTQAQQNQNNLKTKINGQVMPLHNSNANDLSHFNQQQIYLGKKLTDSNSLLKRHSNIQHKMDLKSALNALAALRPSNPDTLSINDALDINRNFQLSNLRHNLNTVTREPQQTAERSSLTSRSNRDMQTRRNGNRATTGDSWLNNKQRLRSWQEYSNY